MKAYITAFKLAVVAALAGIAAYYRAVAKRREGELKDIELDSVTVKLEAQAKAEAADQLALKQGNRRSTDAINRAKSGDRSHFN